MNKIYCIFCGEENNSKDKKCKNPKCGKELNPKSHLYRTYIYEKFKEDIGNSIFSHIISFLRRNLYGIIMSASIIATVSIIIVNGLSNSYITELKEEPIFEYATKVGPYSGAGLSNEQIVNRYVDLLQNNNIEEAKTLLAENYLSKDIIDSIPFDKSYQYYYKGLKHDLLKERNKFFTHLDSKIVQPEAGDSGRFGYALGEVDPVYDTSRYEIYGNYSEFHYCTNNDCNNDENKIIALIEIIETIKVDGNYYILSEYSGSLRDQYLRIERYLFEQHNGDFSNLSKDEFYKIMDDCEANNCPITLPEVGSE